MDSIRLHGATYTFTTAAQAAMKELHLSDKAIFANCMNMWDEGVFNDFLTPTGLIGKEMIEEIRRRRDEYNSPDAIAARVAKSFKDVDKTAKEHWDSMSQRLRDKVATMRLANDQVARMGGKFRGLQGFERQITELGQSVRQSVLDTHIAGWREVSAKRIHNGLKRNVEDAFRTIAVREGLAKALEFMKGAKSCLRDEQPGEALIHFHSTGELPKLAQRPRGAIQSRDHRIIDLGNSGGGSEEGIVWQKKTKPEPTEAVLIIEVTGWNERDGGLQYGTADGRHVLDRGSNLPATAEAHRAVCRIGKRTPDVTYVHYLRPVTEEAKATA